MSLFRLIKFFTVSILVLILSGCQNNSINDEINAATITTSTDLPGTVYVGKNYPVVFTVTNSSSSDNYTGATITSDVTGSGTFTEDTSSYANKCTTTLTAGSACVLKGTFVAADTIPGQLIKATYSYDQGNDVESSTTAVTPVAAVTAATITTSTDLPATVYVGKSYPVVFTVTNLSSSDNYTGATITSDVTGSGTFTEDTSSYANKCTTTLTAGSACVLKGTFVAADTIPGQLIKATYSYDQGNDVESSTTAVTPVAAVTAATITTSTDLPATVYVGKSYPVVFTVTNLSSSDNYTGATITSDVTGSGTFTEDTSSYANKCTTTLTAGSACVLKGTFVAADTIPGQLIKATYSYDQGNDVESSTTAVTPVAAVTAATITTSTDLPATVYVGKSYPVVFTVTNSSSSDNYTGATITSDVTGSGTFTEDTSSYANKCTTTLTAGSACVLKGTFVAADTAAGQLIKATYSYDQGNDVESSTTAVTPVAAVTAATIATSTDLPATVYVGKSYPVVFTVTNSSSSDNYTGATITSNVTGSGTFTEDTSSYANKCTTTLTAGSTCVLKGTFVAADTAAGQLIKATYSYDQGNDVESSTTAVTPVAAVTAATIDTSTDLPGTVYVGKNYPVVFTVTNSSSDNYTGATITSDVTGSGTFTEDTSSYANKCTTTLTAGSACVLKGTFVAADIIPGQLIKATYSYDQGNDVESSTTAVTPVAVTAATIDTSTDLPATVYAGQSYPVVFTVTNLSSSDNYTGATITSNVTGSGTFTEDTSSYANKCTTTLTAGSACVLKGTFVAADATPGQLIKAIYSYDQGNNVESSTTAVTPVALYPDIFATYGVKTGDTLPVTFTVTNNTAFVMSNASFKVLNLDYDVQWAPDTSSYPDKCTSTLQSGSSCVVKGSITGKVNQSVLFQYTHDGLVLNKGFFEGMPNLWVVHNDKSVEHIEAGHNQTVDLTILNGFTTGTQMDMHLGSGLTILSNNCGTSLISASHTCDIKIQVNNSNANQSELIFSQNVGYNGAKLPVRELDLSINPSTYYINFTGTGDRQVQFTNNTAQDLNLSSKAQAYIGTPSSIDLSDCIGKTIAPGNTCNITIHDAYVDGHNSYYGNYELLNGSNVVAKVDISSGKEGSSFICTSKTTSLALSNPLILSTGYGGYTLPILGSGSSGMSKITQTLDQCVYNFRLIQYDYNQPKPGNIFYNGYLRLRDYNLAAVSDTSLQKTVYEFDTLPLEGLKIAWNDTSSAYDVLTFGSKDYRCLYNYSVGFPSWNFLGYQPSKSDPPGMRYLICNTPVLNSFQYVNIDNIVKL